MAKPLCTSSVGYESCQSTSVKALPMHMQDGCRFYDFHQNLQNVRSDIAHFQVPSSTISANVCTSAPKMLVCRRVWSKI